jgi:hypothetical protein
MGKKKSPLIVPAASQHSKMLKDIQKHGNRDSGTYRGIPWMMTRPCRTYWCGYVTYDQSALSKKYKLTKDNTQRLEIISHGGLTSDLGFDCSHIGDYPMSANGTFRTYAYVYGILKGMIDYIVDEAKKTHTS